MTVSQRRIAIARQHGIVNPETVAAASDEVGVPFAAACALLEKESYGGKNVWGNDVGGLFADLPDSMEVSRGAFQVFEYLVVQKGYRSNGVGPCQITWRGFFPDAREKGLKLWLPYDNMLYGFGLLALYRHSEGMTWEEAGARYNGADSYGEDFFEKFQAWRRRFRA